MNDPNNYWLDHRMIPGATVGSQNGDKFKIVSRHDYEYQTKPYCMITRIGYGDLASRVDVKLLLDMVTILEDSPDWKPIWEPEFKVGDHYLDGHYKLWKILEITDPNTIRVVCLTVGPEHGIERITDNQMVIRCRDLLKSIS